MWENKIDTASLHASYLMAVTKGNKMKLEKLKLSSDNQDKTLMHKNSLMKISKPTVNDLFLDKMLFIFDDMCFECKRKLYPEEIISGWAKSHNEYTTKCPIISCSKKFVSRYLINIFYIFSFLLFLIKVKSL